MMQTPPVISERFLAEVYCPPGRATRALLWVLAWGRGHLWARVHRSAVDRSVERYRRQIATEVMPAPAVLDRTRRHSLLGLASVAMVIAVVTVLAALVPFMDTRLLDVLLGGEADADGSLGAVEAIVFLFMFLLLIGGLLIPGVLTGAAMDEEMKYRLGAEQWSGRRRAWMCCRFGFAHLFNLIVPVSVIVGLSLSGALLMWVYVTTYRNTPETVPARRQRAIEESSAVHAAHNVWTLRILAALIGGAVLWALIR